MVRFGVQHWSRDVKHGLEYAGFRVVLACLRALPLDRAAAVVAALMRKLAPHQRRHRRALANLALAFPEKSAAEREAIALAMWDNIGRVIAEAAHLDRFLAEPHRCDPIEMSILDRYAAEGGLYVVASLHTGNWEIGLLPSCLRGYDPAAFYRMVANPLVERYLKTSRERIYTGGLFAVRGETAGKVSPNLRSRQLVACLRKGVPVAILSDHYDHDGVVVPFFGHDLRASRGAATLALQFRARLCVARTIRLGTQSRFTGEAVEIALPDTGDREADIATVTAAIMRHFEGWIRQFPEQWMWSQGPLVPSDAVERVLAAEQVRC